MTVATLAAKFIRVFEGCRLQAYWDNYGKVWTIGFGHTKKVTRGDTITFEQVVELFEQDAAPLIELVKDRPLLETAALVSFGYNCGTGALKRVLSGVISVRQEGFFIGTAAFGETSGGVRLEGLVARRQLEAALIEVSRESQVRTPA